MKMSASEVKNKIGELWDNADIEPVIIERNGRPSYLVTAMDKYVAMPREEYERLRGATPPPRLGFAKDLMLNSDTNALLEVDLSETLRKYL